MSIYRELSDKIAAAENGTGELFDAYMGLWTNAVNLPPEESERLLERVRKIDPDTIQTKAWWSMTQAMRFSFWPGTGNVFEKINEAIDLFQ